jgi:carbamoyl-phosphate synthase large subunit
LQLVKYKELQVADFSKKVTFKVLFTCIGRRVSLLNDFKAAAKELKLNAGFYGTDTTKLSAAINLCDKSFIVKPVKDGGYIKQLFSIVKKNKINLIIPTVDLDLKALADNKQKLAKLGCTVLVSDPNIIEICQDKRKTYKFLHEKAFDTPLTMETEKAISCNNLKFPCFVKPWDGYASRGSAKINNKQELEVFAKRVPNCIVQEYIKGTEYTCDAYVDFNMQVRCVVPRQRIEVRSGEVSKGRTVKDKTIMLQVARLVEILGAGPGVITIQLFLTEDKKIKIIEINPRFGGGAPLSIKAGANFPKWILKELTGSKPNIKFDGFINNLFMLRYDAEVWLNG